MEKCRSADRKRYPRSHDRERNTSLQTAKRVAGLLTGSPEDLPAVSRIPAKDRENESGMAGRPRSRVIGSNENPRVSQAPRLWGNRQPHPSPGTTRQEGGCKKTVAPTQEDGWKKTVAPTQEDRWKKTGAPSNARPFARWVGRHEPNPPASIQQEPGCKNRGARTGVPEPGCKNQGGRTGVQEPGCQGARVPPVSLLRPGKPPTSPITGTTRRIPEGCQEISPG